MSFIILSTGRAGSGYIARLLTESGINTGHEISYNLNGYSGKQFEGESSWLALPFVEEGVYPPNTNIYHQVRNPLQVIGSLVNGEMQQHKDYLEFQYEHCPPHDHERSDYLEYCARYVLEWNERIEALTSVRWQVEAVNFNTVFNIAFREGIALNKGRVVMALSGTSKTTNKHPNTQSIDWTDIKTDTVRTALQEQSKRYGYLTE